MTTENVQPASPAATATPSSPATAATSQPDAAKPDAKPGDAPPADKAAPPADAAKPGDKPADKPADKPKEENFLFDPDKKPDEAKPDGEKKDGEDKPKDGEAPAVTVETLTVPDDMPVPDELKTVVNEAIVAHKLTKEQSQAMIDLGVQMRKNDVDTWQKTKATWLGEIKADPEIGGANAERVKAACNNVVRKFGGTDENKAELQQDLILLGLGNKRSFVKFLNNIAKATGNDSASAGDPGGTGDQPAGGSDLNAMAKRMYPNMN